MRRFPFRDVNLLVALLTMLAMGCLAVVGWQCTLVVQRSRVTTIAVSNQSQLVDAIDASVREAELAKLRYRLSGSEQDRSVSRDADRQVDALAAKLDYRAISEPAARRMLASVMRLVRSRQSVDGQLATVGRILDVERQAGRDNTAGGIRKLRWIVMLLALLGIVAVFSLIGRLSRAWRGLRHAETAQRALALQLRGSLDSLSQGVAVFDAGGLLLHWNLCLRQMLDLPPALLRQGLPYGVLEQHLRLDDAALLEPLPAIHADMARIGRVATDEIHPLVYKRVVQRGAGAQGMQIEIRRTLMRQDGFVLTLTDMTEHVQAERMLYEAQKMQALGQLSGGIAHDFNNILTVILGSLDVGPATDAEAAGTQVASLTTRMRRAARAAETGAALTRQLLAFARKQPLASRNFDSILHELVPLLRHTIGDAIEVTCAMQPGLWPVVADAGQLESALLNLALNARDAMPDGGRISIAAENVSLDDDRAALHADLDPGDYVAISVADTGTGMSSEVIARAFEPFFTTKPEGSGTGLGLAMVSGFARQCGGAVAIQSELPPADSPGTRITLYLPRASVATALSHRPAWSPAPLIPRAASSQLHILVVEDDPLVREITVEILRGLHYRVREAGDAETALRLMELPHGGVDLLLTDLMLPGAIDGRELAARVGALSPQTRILTMSGSIEGMLRDADPHTALDWIGKPFRVTELAAKVQALIGGGEPGDYGAGQGAPPAAAAPQRTTSHSLARSGP